MIEDPIISSLLNILRQPEITFRTKLSEGTTDIWSQFTGQMVCYVARDVYKVPRLHNTCVMLPDVPFHNIKTPVFTLRSVPGNITHYLPGTTV